MEVYRRKPFFFKTFFLTFLSRQLQNSGYFLPQLPSLRKMEKSRVKLLLNFHYLHLSNNQISAKQKVQNIQYYIWSAIKHILITTVNKPPQMASQKPTIQSNRINGYDEESIVQWCLVLIQYGCRNEESTMEWYKYLLWRAVMLLYIL